MIQTSITGKVIGNHRLADSIHEINVKSERFVFKPGQFVWIAVNGKMKPYSIASAPWEPELTFCIKRVGLVSNAICDLKVGDELKMSKPMGVFTLKDYDDYLFIAAGVGMAPFRSMIRALFEKHYSGKGSNTMSTVTLLYGARYANDILYRDNYEDLAKTFKNFIFHTTLSREEKKGFLAGHVQDNLDCIRAEEPGVFICGLIGMVVDVKKTLMERGFPPDKIHIELY